MSPPVSSTQLQSSSSSAHIYQSVSNNTQQFYHNHNHHQLQQANNMPLKGKDLANVASFWDCYEHICSLQNLVPIQSLKASLASEGGTVLNINADKLRSSDWDPIYGALRVNKGLKKISIVSNYNPQNDNDETSRLVKGFAKLKKPPSIRNKDRIKELCRSIKDCLAISHGLNHLEFYNLPMTAKDLAHVAKGLRSNKTLKMLSLERCCIGDEGLATICKDIQSSNNLNRVNFSSCDLTHEGAEILANLIKVQALKRHNEAWKDSLRYGRPDLDSMFGIRRITINSNPKIGDRGVFLLAEAFKSDLWLKALDLQDCGITTQGANFLLDGLKFNAMMHVLDVRLNVKIDRDTLQKIMEQVMINSSGHSTDYEWMDLTQAAAISMNIASKPAKDNNTKQSNGSSSADNNQSSAAQKQTSLLSKQLKKRRNTNASFSKKTQFMSMAGNSLNRMKRCKSTGSVIFNKSALSNTSSHQNHNNNNNHHHHSHESHSGGIPWRTAARANRYRVSTSCAQRKVGSSFREAEDEEEYEEEEDDGNYDDLVDEYTQNKENMEASDDIVEFVETSENRHRSAKACVVNSTFADGRNGLSSANNINQRQSHRKQAEKNEFVSNLDKIKNMSVKDLLVILQREQESKTQLEDMLIKLQEDNTRFKSQISMLRSKVDHQQQELQSQKRNRNNQSTMNKTLLDDDKALEIIELTLYKYQSFLDFLRNAGFGKLIEMGDLNQQEQQQHVTKASKSAMKASKPSKSSSKRQTLSPSTSKLSDQQKYYLEKINKTKSKLNKNMLESTKNYSMSESAANFAENIEGFINYDMVDKSLINGQDNAENHHIDTLLSNALEISRSYRRMNSSSVNNSVMSQYYNPKQHQRANDTNLLSEIEETNRESSSTHTGPDASAQHDALNKQSTTLLMEYKGMKKGSMSSSTLINEESILKPTKHPRSSKKVSKSPDLELSTVLHKMGLSDEKSVMSTGSNGERSQSRQDRSSGQDKSSGAQERSSGTHDHSSGAHDRSEGQEYSHNENSHSNHHLSNNSSTHSHSQSKSRDMSTKKRSNYSAASTLSPANTIVAAGNLRNSQSNESVPPKPISRILQRSQSEVHEDDVSEILSDFDNQADDNEPSSDKPVIFVTSKLKGDEAALSTKDRDDIEFEIDEEDEFYEEDDGEQEEEDEEEEEDEVDEISEIQ